MLGKKGNKEQSGAKRCERDETRPIGRGKRLNLSRGRRLRKRGLKEGHCGVGTENCNELGRRPGVNGNGDWAG